ncbi:MAG: HNH endonuclease [Acidobacteria bacterium]|nr:HNH endonuclease [Acidobacteriota bacterium]
MSKINSGEGRYIPADIRRAVLLESGHACAIPTCQFPATEFAHIEPFAQVKQHEVSNIVALCPNHHHLFDQKKMIDRKAMKVYKLKLQLLNNRYTKYELRLLTVLANKPVVLASGEIEAMGLLTDGLIENAKTFETQSITITDNTTGEMVHTDHFVQSFAARLTPKGRKFIEVWKSSSDNLLDQL